MTSYERVESELKIMLDIFRQQNDDGFHLKLAHLCQQLTRFVGIRLTLLQHFFSLSQLGSEGKWIDFQIEMSRLEKLKYVRGELSVVPSPMQVLGSTVKNEIICLEMLIDSQLKISSWRYMEAMMALSSCKAALLAWNPPQTVQAKKISWASHVKYPGETNLHLWMRMFHNALIAKATLYFHNSLLPHSMTPSLETKLPPELNYYTRLSQFQKQTSANHVAIVLDTNRLDSVYQGHGYHLPNDASVAKPTGVQAYPAILTIPSEIARQHWPTIVSLLTGKPFEATVNPFQIHDKDTLYIACKIDAHMYLVMMYSTRKPPKETPVVSFLSDFVPTLRNAKHYMQIKIS
ncbi:KICSTOR subunit 2-like [Oscarella lobularis]|uniref:KICSTOR subunit 2-like n=1 Tax=Oscarella lobularis TaxID=121494 RepID=UPI0033134E95